MAFFKKTGEGSKEKWQSNLSAAMKQSAKQRTCHECGRGAAMVKVKKLHPTEPQIRQCRYCGANRTIQE